ncbi:ester cyclase [Frigidibacter sp. MR17.14]|uniref:ester cyclase n=1 Tax=Frigidibacter sp. MR17.14 TaxID=3126509 RepID=UPI0030130B63
MRANDLTAIYLSYIDCLNARDWDNLGSWVGDAASYNGTVIGLDGYRAMLERDVAAIPDLQFNVALLLSDPPMSQHGLPSTALPRVNCLALPSMAAACMSILASQPRLENSSCRSR